MDPRDGGERNGSARPDGLATLEDAWSSVAIRQPVSEGGAGETARHLGELASLLSCAHRRQEM